MRFAALAFGFLIGISLLRAPVAHADVADDTSSGSDGSGGSDGGDSDEDDDKGCATAGGLVTPLSALSLGLGAALLVGLRRRKDGEG